MIALINFIIERFSHFGEIPLCNGIASRAPHIFGFCFPLCYRCTFIVLLFFITLFILYKYKKKLPWSLIIIAMMIMIVDGGLQTFFGIMSTNLRRSLTGGLFGVALGAVVTRIYMYLDQES